MKNYSMSVMRSGRMRLSLIAVLVMLSSVARASDDVTFEASAPNTVVNGESFQLVYTLSNVSGKEPRLPEIDGFEIIAGPFKSTSSSVQIINGKMTSEKSTRYTYTLLAQKEGTFTIPPATIVAGREKYQSNALQIKVLPEDKREEADRGGNQARQQPSNVITADNLFIKAVVSRTNVMEQEAISLTFKLYSRLELVDIQSLKFPDLKNFFVQEIDLPQNQQLQLENYNGRNYHTFVVRQYLLYPQQSGTIRIDPMSCDVIVRLRQQRQVRNFFDDFFDTYQDVKRPLRTSPVNINVSALPQPKPADFSGAVGSLSLSSEVSTTELNAHESMTLTLKIKGSGNMKMIKTPEIDFPQDFETYEPKVTNNFKTTASGVSGTKTIEYLAIPRHDGNFTIPSVSISYYDTKDEKYKTISTDSYNIRVNKGQSSDVQQGTVVSNYTSQEQVQVLASDIRYINTKPLELRNVPTVFAGSPQFWMMYLVPLLVSCGLLFFFRKQARENADVALMRNRKANKVARKRLKVAETEWKSGNKERFYDEILKALWGYLCDKLSMPLSDLNKENVATELEQHAVPADVIETFIGLLHKCEFEQYAPLTDSRAAMDKIFEETISMISTLESCIKKK